MRIVFWGTPQISVPTLKILINSKHEVIAVVSQPDRKRGRGSKQIPSPIKQLADSNSIEVLTPKSIKADNLSKQRLKEMKPDLFLVLAFGQILPKEILEIPTYGSWNIHASLLPRWRGAAPIQWALISGDKETGVGFMHMEETLDTGPLMLEQKIRIDSEDNLKT